MYRCQQQLSRNFTFLEVLIALVLSSLVLGTLFTTLYEVSAINFRLERGEKEVLTRAEFQQKMNAIFASLTPSNTQRALFTQSEGGPVELHLRFLRGIDPDPRFSGQLMGILKIEEEGLSLKIFGDEPLVEREEVVRKGVTDIKYEFLSHEAVYNSWDKDKELLPNYLKISLVLEENKKEDYVFWINKEPVGMLIP